MSWSSIQGHDSLVAAFDRVVRRGRLAHAYLFSGPRGVGKRMFAHELGKALLCERRDPAGDFAACDQCVSCTLVAAGTHPDFFTVGLLEEKNVVTIEQMQELCGGFGLKSARGRGKVAVLDDVDELHAESANCFLKTLEEPPPRSVFILIGTSTDQQLATILSRCQVVRFRPLPDAVVEKVLRDNEIADPKLLQAVVQMADGSPGQALALADSALWEFRKKLLDGLSKPRIDTFALGKAFIEFVEDAGKEGALQRRRATLVIGLLVDALTDALALSVGGEPKTADAEDARLLRALTARATPEKILALIERCLETEAHIGRYVQLVLVLEGLLDALAQLLEDGAAATAARR